MKTCLLFTFFISFQLIAQIPTKEKLLGSWVKADFRTKDSSAIHTPQIVQTTVSYYFMPNDSVRITYNGNTTYTKYQLNDDILKIGRDVPWKIEYLSDLKLILQADADKSPSNGIKMIMIPAKYFTFGFVPETYISAGEDTIYIAKKNFLEPFFIDAQQNVMEFIYANFDFPQYKKGEFNVRFIITNKGEIKAIKILSSNQEKYNEKLIKAIRKTKGKWQAAIWEGKSVNTEMQLFFDMKQPDEELTTKSNTNNPNLSNEFFLQGNEFLDSKNYRQALEYFNKSIELDAYNVSAYYNRAACYIVLKQRESACKDFQTLVNLEQKRAESLLNKFCK